MAMNLAKLRAALERAGVKTAKAERQVRDLKIENDRLRKRVIAAESIGTEKR